MCTKTLEILETMAGIHPWQVPIFGKTYPSHQVVIAITSAVAAGIAYAVLKPKNYDVKKYVEGLPKEKQDLLKSKNIV